MGAGIVVAEIVVFSLVVTSDTVLSVVGTVFCVLLVDVVFDLGVEPVFSVFSVVVADGAFV